MSVVAMATLEERERLLPEFRARFSGFEPRSVRRLATRKKPVSLLDLECRHFLRSRSEDFTHGQTSVEHRLWVEAGKCAAPYPQDVDAHYNSNVWRNFRKQFGFNTRAEGRKIDEVIASLYPVNIPPPSKIGENSFTKYICEGELYQDDRLRQLAIKQATSDHEQIRKLKIKSESRNPPIDEDGKILPPENFRRYLPRFIPPQPDSPPALLPEGEYRTDLFGRRYVRQGAAMANPPHLWKLTYRLNQTQGEAVRARLQERDERRGRGRGGVTAPSPASP